MKRYLKVYLQIVRFALMKTMAYPQDFFIWSIVDFTWTMVGLGFFRMLFLRVPVISGWTFNQLTLLLGLINVIAAFVWGLMYQNMKELVRDINKGNLDIYLSKPVNSQFLVSTKEISFSLFPKLLTGTFLVVYSLNINSQLNFYNILLIVFSVLSAVFIAYSLYFLSVTNALLFGRLANLAELFPHSLDAASYPTSIFSPIMQLVFTFIIPFALMAFIPASIILGRINVLWILCLPIAALVLLFLSNRYWSFAIKHYSSASS